MKKISRTIISILICGAILFGMTTVALADNDVLRLTVAADTYFQSFTEFLTKKSLLNPISLWIFRITKTQAKWL